MECRMDRGGFLYKRFLSQLEYAPTPCQERLLRHVSDFLTADDGDILVVNGYAGTGKTTALAAVVACLESNETGKICKVHNDLMPVKVDAAPAAAKKPAKKAPAKKSAKKK